MNKKYILVTKDNEVVYETNNRIKAMQKKNLLYDVAIYRKMVRFTKIGKERIKDGTVKA